MAGRCTRGREGREGIKRACQTGTMAGETFAPAARFLIATPHPLVPCMLPPKKTYTNTSAVKIRRMQLDVQPKRAGSDAGME